MLRLSLFAFLSLFLASPVLAADTVMEYKLILKEHRFEPATLEIPADTKFKLIVNNQDSTPEEFESNDLKREKIVKGGKEITINAGPLKPGTYKFFGEFHPQTAQGEIIVK